MEYWAHTREGHPPHPLAEHLKQTAEQARRMAEAFGAGDLAFWAGLWHDLGKFTRAFQDYLKTPNERGGPHHSHAGARLAREALGRGPAGSVIPWVVAGHHTGLTSREDLDERLAEAQDPASRNGRLAQEAIEAARRAVPDLVPGEAPRLPAWLEGLRGQVGKRAVEFFIRMVFSALVDADSLDTEAYLHPERSRTREEAPSLDQLAPLFFADQERLLREAPDTPVNRVRREVYEACLRAAEGPQGLYRLTVPTGGGKTRSAMAFALKHALHHGLRRVVVAIPYTSIIEQTAEVYREAFRPLGRAVLEHHSAVARAGSEEQGPDALWARLAEENWDAPVIVTTFVRLFESLLSNRRSDCRRLHNLARSVIVLDEVQTLPVGLLEPALDVLRELVGHYGVTVVLCSATLPAFSEARVPLPKGAEIVQNFARHFADPALRRVRYEVVLGQGLPWDAVAREMRKHRQCMAVVNRLRDSLALWEALGEHEHAFYLSTYLCPAHRSRVLAEVRGRLQAGEPCYLVCTPVVEAGVDIDFPAVLRALGPLDRIVQAGGRCNREGRLGPEGGRVWVFEPAEGGLPKDAPYETGTALAREVLQEEGPDRLHDPDLYRRYYRRLFGHTALDEKDIQKLRDEWNFPQVAQRFRLIKDDGLPVVVRYPPERERVEKLLAELRENTRPPREALRDLQPYMVEVSPRELPRLREKGLIREVRPGLWEWLGTYDDRLGLGATPTGTDPSLLLI